MQGNKKNKKSLLLKRILGKKTRKAATPLSIFMLVMLALVLTGWALFIFATETGKIEKKILDARAIEEVYAQEEKTRFFLQELGEEVLIKSNYNLGNFKENIKIEIRKYETAEFGNLKEKIEAGEFSANLQEGKLVLAVKLEIKKSFKITEQKYVLKIIPYGTEEKENTIVYKPEIKTEFEIPEKN